MNRLRPVLLSLCLIAAAAVVSGQAVPASPATDSFTFALKPGPHAVGFRTVLQYDYSRTFHETVDAMGKPYTGEFSRPIETLIWYPAEESAKAPIVFGEYLALKATETDFQPSKTTLDDVAKANSEYGNVQSQKTWAVKDAAPAAGLFPVVIYAPSFSAPAFENSDLLEYLASNGYIVISSPDMGAHTRGMTGDLPGIEAQRGDIAFLISFAHTVPHADLSHIAVAGFSWGGISNLFAAARDSRIGALISLDGSARYFPKLIADSGYVQPKKITIPVLFFRQGGMSLEEVDQFKQMTAGPNALNELTHADLYLVHMYWMYHGDFSSTFQRDPGYWKGTRDPDFTRPDADESYGWVARYVLNFLDANFKNDAGAKEFLKRKPSENGAPAHLFSVDYRAAKGFAPTMEAFRTELSKSGFDHGNDVYTAFKGSDADFKLEEGAMNDWGYGLLRDGHPAEAIEIFKFNTVLYPDSANTYDSLAEAYAANSQKDLAIANYEKALAKNPESANAKAQLEKLKNPPKK